MSTPFSLQDVIGATAKLHRYPPDQDPLNMAEALLRHNRQLQHGQLRIDGQTVEVRMERLPQELRITLSPVADSDAALKVTVHFAVRAQDDHLEIVPVFDGKTFGPNEETHLKSETAGLLINAVNALFQPIPYQSQTGEGLINRQIWQKTQTAAIQRPELVMGFEGTVKDVIKGHVLAQQAIGAIADAAKIKPPTDKTRRLLRMVKSVLSKRYSGLGKMKLLLQRNKVEASLEELPDRLRFTLSPISDASAQLQAEISLQGDQLTITPTLMGQAFWNPNADVQAQREFVILLNDALAELVQPLPLNRVAQDKGFINVQTFYPYPKTIDLEALAERASSAPLPDEKNAITARPERDPREKAVTKLLVDFQKGKLRESLSQVEGSIPGLLSELREAFSDAMPFNGRILQRGEVPSDGITLDDLICTRFGTSDTIEICRQLAISEEIARLRLFEEVLQETARNRGIATNVRLTVSRP